MGSSSNSSVPNSGSQKSHDSAVACCPNVATPGEKKPVEDKKEVELILSLFFDGTNNNRINTKERIKNEDKPKAQQSAAYKKHGIGADTSYQNDFTNVVRLEQYYYDKPGTNYKIYVEGIGTQDLDGDAKLGQAVGEGDTGVINKVKSGLEQVKLVWARALEENPDAKKFRVVFNAFGFSRGAAAARNFVHEVDTRLNEFKAFFSRKERNLQGVKVNFVGLFDTVASYGYKMDFSSGTEKLSLDAVKSAAMVVQLAAADEYRENFALTDIKSAGGKGLQLFLPGAHSDIGGGYRKVAVEDFTIFKHSDDTRRQTEIAAWLEDGWIRDRTQIVADGSELVLKRTVQNDYARIPLLKMTEQAKKGGLIFRSKMAADVSVAHDSSLQKFKAAIDSYCQKKGNASRASDWTGLKGASITSELKDVRYKYLHVSFNLETTWTVAVNKPHLNSAGKRERVVYEG